jgi:phytanoyl-CoA hydroxylase
MLTQEQIEDFHTRGFLNLGKIYSDDECAKMRAEMFRVMHEETERKPVLNRGMGGSGELTVVQIVNMWQASDMYLRHAEHPIIAEAVAQLCDTDTLRIWHDQVQYKPPTKGGPTGWHQDHPLWPTIQPADLISSWMPMEDATQQNGCMWMVPGSHKWGNQQRYIGSREPFEPFHREPAQLPEGAEIFRVPTEVMKGECQLHHCLTWHGSPANPSDKDRPAIAVHYMPAHTRHDPVGSHVMDEWVTVAEGEILEGEVFPVVYNSAS